MGSSAKIDGAGLELELARAGFWSSNLVVSEGRRKIARVARSVFSKRATFAFEGHHFALRTHGWSEQLELTREGLPLARVRRRAWLDASVDVDVGDWDRGLVEGERFHPGFVLQHAGWLTPAVDVLLEGERIGGVAPRGIFKSGACLTFRSPIPRPLAILMGFAVLRGWEAAPQSS